VSKNAIKKNKKVDKRKRYKIGGVSLCRSLNKKNIFLVFSMFLPLVFSHWFGVSIVVFFDFSAFKKLLIIFSLLVFTFGFFSFWLENLESWTVENRMTCFPSPHTINEN